MAKNKLKSVNEKYRKRIRAIEKSSEKQIKNLFQEQHEKEMREIELYLIAKGLS